MIYDLKAYDHNAPRKLVIPSTGGARDGVKTMPREPIPLHYIANAEGYLYEIVAMQYRSDTEAAVKAWLAGRTPRKFYNGLAYDRWVVLGDRLSTYANWEFHEMFRPAIMCGYDQ